MKSNIKRALILLVVIMLCCVFAAPLAAPDARAAGGVEAKLLECLQMYPDGSRWTTTFAGASTCYGFAKMIVYELFGNSTVSGKVYRTWDYDGTSDSGMVLIGSVDDCSASSMQRLLSQARPGDVMQFDRGSGSQHSMIVWSVDSDGVNIYECNWEPGTVTLTKETWAGMADRQSWSGRGKLSLLRSDNYDQVNGTLSADSSGSTDITITGAVSPSGTLTPGNSFGLRGIISSASTLTNVSGYIYDSTGKAVMTYSKNPGGASYDIQTGGLNAEFLFGTLAAGSYRYTVEATNSAGVSKMLIDQDFIEGTPSSKYTIRYDANGGSGAPSAQTKTHGTDLTLSTVKPTRSGYSFKGWATSRYAGTAKYTAGGKYSRDSAVTLYAVWGANKPSITGQPSARKTAAGQSVSFSVTASGAGLKYQWQYSDNGTTWKNCSSAGYNKATFSFKAGILLHNRQYRCKVSNSAGDAVSDAAKLTVVGIKTQPVSQTVTEGNTATFKVAATGASSYQWQYSDNGTTWTDCRSTGYNKDVFSFRASAVLNNRQYRCQIKNGSVTATSDAAKLTVLLKPTITTQPKAQTVASGKTATFTVAASGAISYQWQYSMDNGGKWTNCISAGCDTATFSFKTIESYNGRLYRCVVKNSAGSVNTSTAKLTVSNVKPTITAQPTLQNVTAGTKVSFKVVAAGSNLTYRWQYSDNGTTWTNCKSTGYNTATFTFTASVGLNGRQYRCVVSNTYGSTISTAGKLTVK